MPSLYDTSVPVFIRALTNLSSILKKGEEFTTEKNIAETKVLQETRLAPDMQGLAYQIQRVSDSSKGTIARVSGLAAPSFADNETTYAELQARIQKTIDFLKTVKPSDLDGKEKNDVLVKLPSGEFTQDAQSHILLFGIPNFFFHVTTAYGLLRHLGVPIGKADYLGPLK